MLSRFVYITDGARSEPNLLIRRIHQ